MDQATSDTAQDYTPTTADLVSELASRQRWQRELALEQAIKVCLHRGDNSTEWVLSTAEAFYVFLSSLGQIAADRAS